MSMCNLAMTSYSKKKKNISWRGLQFPGKYVMPSVSIYNINFISICSSWIVHWDHLVWMWTQIHQLQKRNSNIILQPTNIIWLHCHNKVWINLLCWSISFPRGVFEYVGDCETFEDGSQKFTELYEKPKNEIYARHILGTSSSTSSSFILLI